MKRRQFLSRLAAAPFVLGCAWGVASVPEAQAYDRAVRTRLSLDLSEAEKSLLAFLRQRAPTCHLYGAPVMARARGISAPWLNLVAPFEDFAGVKRDLFRLGVSPVSTPDLPGTVIKFRHAGQVVNLVNADIDSFCQSLYFAMRERRAAFTHSFLVWDPAKSELHTPCNPGAGLPEPFALVGRPVSPHDAFDWVLSGRLESKLTGLGLPGEFELFEEETLETDPPAIASGPVTERIVNYFPEVVDRLGMDYAGRLAGSRLVRRSVKESLGVDFRRVFSAFVAARRREPRLQDSGVQFMSALHGAGGVLDDFSVLQGEVCRFMVSNKFTFRRPEWLIAPTAMPVLEPADQTFA